MTVFEISDVTVYDEISVLGALIGYKNRYKPEDALVALGLVTVNEDEYHGQKIKIFSAVSNWKDINEVLNNYTRHNNLSGKPRRY